MTPPHRRLLGVIVGIVLSAPLISGSPAAGAPLDDKRREAARLEAQLDETGHELSLKVEAYNQARLKVEQVQSDLEQARADIASAEQRMEAARDTVSAAAIVAYTHGGTNTLIAQLARSADHNEVVTRRQYLRLAVADQQDALGALKAAREDLEGEQERLASEEEAAESAAGAADEARRAAADIDARQRALLDRAKGDLATLVAEEAARREAAQARAAAPTPPPPAARPAAGGPIVAAAKPGPAPVVAAPAASSGAAAAVSTAQAQVGKPYQWGGEGPDTFDCSGLMLYAWRAGGVRLSHSAQSQYHETRRVPRDAVQPGDILFFGSSTGSIGHNGMYVGNGQMVHASQTGQPVKYSNAWRNDLVGIGRPG